MRVYRAVCRKVAEGEYWDSKIKFIDPSVHQAIQQIINQLTVNKWYEIEEPRHLSYDDADYDYIIYTDASIAGWGAIVKDVHNKSTCTYQRRWVNTLDVDISKNYSLAVKQVKKKYGDEDHMWTPYGKFTAKYSAHAEPRAAKLIL